MGVETAGAPPGGFFQRKKCSTQRILCQVDDGNSLELSNVDLGQLSFDTFATDQPTDLLGCLRL